MSMKILLFAIVFSMSGFSQKLELVHKTDGIIWGIDMVDESNLVFTNRDGRAKLLNLKTKKEKAINHPKVEEVGQGGLLDVHFHKEKDKEYIYYSFSEKTKDKKVVTSLARGEWADSQVNGLKTIFTSNAHSETSRHFGSRIEIIGDQLFLSIGDRGVRDQAQKLSSHNGSVLRMKLDGSAYPGNPFKDSPFIFSYGHRNPQGMDSIDGKLYVAEMGPRGGDELNLVEKAKNYGWPEITYGSEYWGPKIGKEKKAGMEQPLVYWTPSISPSGMAFYTGDKLKALKGKLFIGCLSGSQVRQIELVNGKVKSQKALFEDKNERFRDVLNGIDGHLYLSTDSGKIFRVN